MVLAMASTVVVMKIHIQSPRWSEVVTQQYHHQPEKSQPQRAQKRGSWVDSWLLLVNAAV